VVDAKRIQDIRDRLKELQEERRRSLESKALDVAEYLAPSRGRFPSDDRRPDRLHSKRGDKIIDPFAQDALEIAQNGMHSGMTNPSRPWIRFAFLDEGLNKWGPAKAHLELIQKQFYGEVRRSNFYSAMHNNYGEVLCFSNLLMSMRELDQGGFRFRPFTFGEYWLARNALGVVDTVYRTESLSARQLAQEFGRDTLSTAVRSDLDSNRKMNAHEILHAVQPRENRDVSRRDRLNMPFESVWMELTSSEEKVLRESGFTDFPYVHGAWTVIASDNWGCDGPGFKKLADIKMLQDVEESTIMAQHRELDPSLLVPESMKATPIRKNGGITFYSGNPEAVKRLFEFKFDYNAGEVRSAGLRQRIAKGFYNDLFLMLQSGQLKAGTTAFQVAQMQAEALLQLGPFIERMEDDVLDPTVMFMVSRMIARPYLYNLPPLPRELVNARYKIEYISLLAQAQRMVGIKAIDDTVQYAKHMAQLNPEANDIYDFDELGRERADLVGLSSSGIRDERVVAQIRKDRARKVQAMQAAQEAMAATQAAKTLSETALNPEEPSALTALTGGAEAQA
jgi:hypothetical protein